MVHHYQIKSINLLFIRNASNWVLFGTTCIKMAAIGFSFTSLACMTIAMNKTLVMLMLAHDLTSKYNSFKIQSSDNCYNDPFFKLIILVQPKTKIVSIFWIYQRFRFVILKVEDSTRQHRNNPPTAKNTFFNNTFPHIKFKDLQDFLTSLYNQVFDRKLYAKNMLGGITTLEFSHVLSDLHKKLAFFFFFYKS